MIQYRVEYVDRLSVDLLRQNPDAVGVFGDNLEKWGKAGQAVIRHESNAHGIPTKRRPSMDPDAFFSDQDSEIEAVAGALRGLLMDMKSGKRILVPRAGIGTGLARLPEKSPKIYVLIRTFFAWHACPLPKGPCISVFDHTVP